MFVYMYVTAATGRQPKCSKQINNKMYGGLNFANGLM